MIIYTPGSWRVNPVHFHDVETLDGALSICRAWDMYDPLLVRETRRSGPSFDEACGNARLMAASPMMYEALKAFEEGSSRAPALMRAALAQVEGES